mmetsp:Transcript_5788/g.16418  ORF Transcript_5788/g.16418 Transcript_5788/m.16418 type:complete len:301 (+) Transcript_5788:205-1107(+)
MTATRVYNTWPSNNIFLCRGRLITGPDKRYFFLSLSFMLVTISFHLGFSADYIAHDIHPSALAMEIWLILLVLSSFLTCAFMDAGIIPRRSKPSELDQNKNPLAKHPKSVKITCGGVDMTMKYCNTCNIYRPPRCSHCSVCDNCVDKFDHHCPWIGNCVARRNYRFFLTFIFSTTTTCLYLAAMCITEITFRTKDSRKEGASAFGDALGDNPVALLVALFALFAASAVGGLSLFHVYLNCNNVSTNEQLKGSYKKIGNPFWEGYCMYMVNSLCQSKRASFIHPRRVLSRMEVIDSFDPDV